MVTRAPATSEVPSLAPETRAAYARMIHDRYGLRLSPHQLGQVDGVVARIARAEGEHDAAALLRSLSSGGRSDLLERLAAHFTIGETHFFRIGPQVNALRDSVLPDLVARVSSRCRLRVWSAGCSTGEEPYTLAMLLREHAGVLAGWDVEIVGTDLNHAALAAAREARYGAWSFRGTTDEARRRYFQPDGECWRLRPAIRDMVTFRHLNLAAEVFPTWASSPEFDLILCHNVTIYFGPDVTARLYAHLARALAPGGWLVIGPSDPTPAAHSGLAPVYLGDTILWRRQGDVAQADRLASAESPTLPVRGRRRATAPGKPTGPARRLAPAAAQRIGATASDRPDAGVVGSALVPEPPLGRGAGSDVATGPIADEQPLDPQAHLEIGLDHLEAGRLDLAVGCLRRATFLRSEHTVSQFALGRAYLLRGDPSRARPALLHARRLLAGRLDDELVAEGDGLRAGELQQAVEALLAADRPMPEGA